MDQLLCNVTLYIYISVLVKDRFYVDFVYGISSPTNISFLYNLPSTTWTTVCVINKSELKKTVYWSPSPRVRVPAMQAKTLNLFQNNSHGQ